MERKTSLQRTMIIYFLLVGFASLLVGVEFVFDANSPTIKSELLLNIEKYSKGEISDEELFHPMVWLRNKAILMLAIILFVMVIVLTMFVKNISEPLQHMIRVSEKIAVGDLSQTISIRSHNELAELGNVINDMSSNLQEIILLAQNMRSAGGDFIQNTDFLMERENLNSRELEKIKKEISNLKSELDSFTEVVEYFEFYTVEDKI